MKFGKYKESISIVSLNPYENIDGVRFSELRMELGHSADMKEAHKR
jgi:hypothetical protein